MEVTFQSDGKSGQGWFATPGTIITLSIQMESKWNMEVTTRLITFLTWLQINRSSLSLTTKHLFLRILSCWSCPSLLLTDQRILLLSFNIYLSTTQVTGKKSIFVIFSTSLTPLSSLSTTQLDVLLNGFQVTCLFRRVLCFKERLSGYLLLYLYNESLGTCICFKINSLLYHLVISVPSISFDMKRTVLLRLVSLFCPLL